MKVQFREPWEKLKEELGLVQGKRKLTDITVYEFWAWWKDLCPLAIRKNRLKWVTLAQAAFQKSLCLPPRSWPAHLGLCLQPAWLGIAKHLGIWEKRGQTIRTEFLSWF